MNHILRRRFNYSALEFIFWLLFLLLVRHSEVMFVAICRHFDAFFPRIIATFHWRSYAFLCINSVEFLILRRIDWIYKCNSAAATWIFFHQKFKLHFALYSWPKILIIHCINDHTVYALQSWTWIHNNVFECASVVVVTKAVAAKKTVLLWWFVVSRERSFRMWYVYKIQIYVQKAFPTDIPFNLNVP